MENCGKEEKRICEYDMHAKMQEFVENELNYFYVYDYFKKKYQEIRIFNIENNF